MKPGGEPNMKSPGGDEGGDAGGELSHSAAAARIASSTWSSGVETSTESVTSICLSQATKSRTAFSSRWFGAATRNSKQKSSVKREAATNCSSLRQGSPAIGTLSVGQSR